MTQQVSNEEVDVFLKNWITSIESFDFDRFGKLISDNAAFSVTDPISREVRQLNKVEYIALLRPLADTYSGYDFIIDDRTITVTGKTASVKLRGKQKVTHSKGTITRGMSSEFTITKIAGRLVVVDSIIIPDEKADYNRVVK